MQCLSAQKYGIRNWCALPFALQAALKSISQPDAAEEPTSTEKDTFSSV
jgi:hypothetical protein